VSGAGVFGEQVSACRERLAVFRRAVYRSLTRWPDALFELCDAVLCTPGPVSSLPELSLVRSYVILKERIFALTWANTVWRR
jgi:hypothetical protein